MKVSITSIDQSYSLENGEVTNYLVIKLPSGRTIRAQVNDDVVGELGNEAAKPAESEPEPEVASPEDAFVHEFNGYGQRPDASQQNVEETPIDVVEQYEHHVESGVVEWEKLPDTQLPPHMKKILRDSRINAIISIEDLEALKAQILERIGKPAKPGKVDWNAGQRRQANSRQRRTVPMDEAGNPIPPGGIMEADPGEGPDDDDDGVSQA